LPGGDIEFLGRIDYQVKIRGYRIELGEIEAVLGGHPLVREAVVLAREDVPGDKRLVAYLVPSDAGPTTKEETFVPATFVSELRSYLKEKLPDYMLPSVFVTLEALPWTSSGKVDRRALPAPDGVQAKEAYVAPRTPTEGQLATMMAQILNLDRVGINDDFFALGGHSLLATQLASRVNRAFQISLPVRAIFEQSSVAKLAQRVVGKQLEQRASSSAHPGAHISSIPTSLRDQSVPLSFAQQRLWFLDQLSPGSPVYNIPVAHRLSGPLDVAALERSLNEIIRRHETLRTIFATVDGQPAQIIAPAWTLSLPLVDLGGLDGEREAEVRRLSTQEAQRAFDLARGPLVRATCLRLGKREHVLPSTCSTASCLRFTLPFRLASSLGGRDANSLRCPICPSSTPTLQYGSGNG
jgi:acyl carrier protein